MAILLQQEKLMDSKNIIPTLKEHILIDGFHVVADTKKSEGSVIVDAATGNRYLDCYSQFASQALGWNHPSLVARKNELADVVLHKMANSDMYSEAYAEFVQKFSEVTPDFKYYFFIDGGALAVENALKAAFDWKAQKLGISSSELTGEYNYKPENQLNVIHLENAFHGRSGYTLSVTNTGPLKTKWFPKFGWSRISTPSIGLGITAANQQLLEEAAISEAKHAFKNSNVAAILLEPIQGEGGDNHFRKEFFQALRELADRYEAMLIFDEVQTGLGLTGKMWCYEHFGVIPDLMCFGKKTQVCGFCSTDRIDEVDNNVFKISGRINSTWGGNIVDMKRCSLILDAIKDEALVENAREIGKYFRDELMSVGGCGNVRGRGLMLAFDLASEEARDKVFKKLSKNMLALKCGTKSIRFRPHLTFSKEDADKAIEFIKMAL
jgi:L-lysine 6-transaminase